MSFQSTVYNIQGFGVPGELFTDSPYQAQPYTIQSASAAYNIIGATVCTITSQGFCQAGAGGTLGFAGFLVDPKASALFGTGGVPLAPTLTLNNFQTVQCLTMGVMIVTLPAAANIGDNVIFDNTTGAISTIAQGVDVPVGKTFANAIVSYFTQGIAGTALAVITVNPTFLIPTHA